MQECRIIAQNGSSPFHPHSEGLFLPGWARTGQAIGQLGHTLTFLHQLRSGFKDLVAVVAPGIQAINHRLGQASTNAEATGSLERQQD